MLIFLALRWHKSSTPGACQVHEKSTSVFQYPEVQTVALESSKRHTHTHTHNLEAENCTLGDHYLKSRAQSPAVSFMFKWAVDYELRIGARWISTWQDENDHVSAFERKSNAAEKICIDKPFKSTSHLKTSNGEGEAGVYWWFNAHSWKKNTGILRDVFYRNQETVWQISLQYSN